MVMYLMKKPAGSNPPPDNNRDKDGDNKEENEQLNKANGKKIPRKWDNWSSSGSQDGLVCHDKDTLDKGQKLKYPKDHISVHVTQRTGRVVLMDAFGLLKEGQNKSDIFFNTDVTLVDGTILQGGEWPSVPWYPHTPTTGAPTRDLSWFIKIRRSLSPRVWAIEDFPYPGQLHLVNPFKLWKTSDIPPKWGVYIEYPLPAEWGQCTMATGISKGMGGPHIEKALSPFTPTSIHQCAYCNKSHNSRDSLVNHMQFHYRMVLVCPICGGWGSNHWKIIKAHIKKCVLAQPAVAEWEIEPGKLLWKKSDKPLRDHTRAQETESTYNLLVWPDWSNDKEASDWGQIIEHILTEWQVQVDDIRVETATAKAAKVDKDGDGENAKDDSKDTKSKSKHTTHKGRGQKSSSSKKVDLAEDNLDEFFGLSQKKNSQETPDVTLDEPQRSLKG